MNQKVTGRAMSIPGGLAVGALWATGITLGLAALMAKIIDLQWMSMEKSGYGVMLLLVLASFTGAMVSCGKVKHQKLMLCLASGAVYWGILLSITAIFFGGRYEAVPETGLMILCGCGLAVLITGTRQGRGKPHKKRRS